MTKITEDLEFQKYNLRCIHYHLSSLVSYKKGNYEVARLDLYLDHFFDELCKGIWGNDLLKSHTIKLFDTFSIAWKRYQIEEPIGEDGVFCFYDPKWNKIIQNCLIPLLDHFEMDLINQNISIESYKKILSQNTRPTDEELLERGRTLYNLLIKHDIIRKG